MSEKAGVPEKTGSKPLRIIKALAPWLVSGGLIAFVLLTGDVSRLLEDFKKIRLLIFLATAVPFLLGLWLIETVFFLAGFRWFAKVGGFKDLLRARAATYLLTIISIFVGLGGLVVWGRKRYDISYQRGTAIVLNELLHELASQCTLAMLVGLTLPEALIPDRAMKAVAGVTLVGAIGVGVYLFIVFIAIASRYLPKKYRTNGVLDPFLDIPLWRYGAFYAIKLFQNVLYGLFLAGILLSFTIEPPLIASIGFMQVIHLTRAIPVSAFGIGVDQVAIDALFKAWEPAGTELLLAASSVFTFTLIFGRALLGVPFLKGVMKDAIERRTGC